MRPPVPRDMVITNAFFFFGILLWALPFMRLRRMNSIFGPTQLPDSVDWANFRSACSKEWMQAFLFVSVAMICMRSMKWFLYNEYLGHHSTPLQCVADGNTGIGSSQICAYYQLLFIYCILLGDPWCGISSHLEYRFSEKRYPSWTCRGRGELSCDNVAHKYRFWL